MAAEMNLLIFYSFGPNRKRDSNLGRDRTLQADDIGIVFKARSVEP